MDLGKDMSDLRIIWFVITVDTILWFAHEAGNVYGNVSGVPPC